MITRVKVKNFRNLADVDVELGPMTVLVGRNGAGKSTFLDVLRFVRDALRLGLETAVGQRGGISALRHLSSRDQSSDIEISCELGQLNGWMRYSFVIGGQTDECRVKQEQCEIFSVPPNVFGQYEIKEGQWVAPPNNWLPDDHMARSVPITSSKLMLPMVANSFSTNYSALFKFLIETSFYSIFPNTMREPQKPTSEETLQDNGANLATVIRQLKRQDERFMDIVSALKLVVDDVSDARVQQVGGYLIMELAHTTGGDQPAWLELSQESDGTLRMLGILTALYQPFSRTLTAVEEPELAIHPGALAVLADVLREASQRTQVLITTQSPDLISRFNADQLRVVERVNGVTQIGPVDEIQREAINDQLFSAGDLLRIEGLHLTPNAATA